MAPILSMAFLGSALSSTLIYIWSRKNPDTLLSFLGLVVFKAPYLPWVLLCFSLVMHGTVPKDEMCGIVVGHSTYTHPLHVRRELTWASLVLLQRRLPTPSSRPQPSRPTRMVATLLRWPTPTSRNYRRHTHRPTRQCKRRPRGTYTTTSSNQLASSLYLLLAFGDTSNAFEIPLPITIPVRPFQSTVMSCNAFSTYIHVRYDTHIIRAQRTLSSPPLAGSSSFRPIVLDCQLLHLARILAFGQAPAYSS